MSVVAELMMGLLAFDARKAPMHRIAAASAATAIAFTSPATALAGDVAAVEQIFNG